MVLFASKCRYNGLVLVWLEELIRGGVKEILSNYAESVVYFGDKGKNMKDMDFLDV